MQSGANSTKERNTFTKIMKYLNKSKEIHKKRCCQVPTQEKKEIHLQKYYNQRKDLTKTFEKYISKKRNAAKCHLHKRKKYIYQNN